MTQAAAKTGMAPTMTAAAERQFPQALRIYDDELAAAILPFSMRALVWFLRFPFLRNWMIDGIERRAPGLWGGIMCRKQYIDDILLASLPQIENMVNLGAGLDTRAYRLAGLEKLAVWEIDQPQNIETKQQRLMQLFGAVPAHVRLVALDFDHQELLPVLQNHGYVPGSPTFFVWEAVTQYLTAAGVHKTFEVLAQAGPGSRLAFTYVREDFIRGQAMYNQEAIYAQYVSPTAIWQFGMNPDEVEDFLARYGWRVRAHLGYEDLAVRYIPPARKLGTTPLERVVYAEKV